ncbi:MAG: undecaprenyl/decaprenyl-phosphate alpha-N-acetylglucosaminyl 1-phosphate transferase [Bacteroidetes bacterium CHB5]|nr:undecaprenyl/decaprenyl-phosphate alpha-N-acetylglucosaminyl 1-phosphate transferase [Bacteroidetes bacterium CHB5]
MLTLLFYTAISFLVAFLFFPVFIKVLGQWRLFDSAGDHKIHTKFTPSMGGLAILLGALVALSLSLSFQSWVTQRFFFVSLTLMFIIGMRDDILALSPKQKLYSQFLPVLVLVLLDRTFLHSTYGLIGDVQFPEWAGMAMTIFVILILTNAYNLIDGLDGLAGTIGLIILTCYGTWFFLIGDLTLSYIACCFAGALVAFLYFNWQPSRIFMGDTGALMIGLLISYLSIKFIITSYQLPEQHPYRFPAPVATAICILIIPIFDTLRVIILRLRKLQSPFKADRNHLHHQFIKLGFSHRKSVLSIAGINLLFLALALLLHSQGNWLILGIALIVCLGINFLLKFAQARMAHGRQD